MADLAKSERAAAAQIYAPADNRAARVRADSARLIENVIQNTRGKPEIEIYLAIGSVCKFTSRWDCAIWLEEVARLMDGRVSE